MRKSTKTNPPFYVWLIATAMVFLITGLCYLYPTPYNTNTKQRQLLHLQACLDNLESDWPFDSNQLKVVIWGSSFTCQGIRHQPYFQKELSSICGKDVLVQKLYMLKASAGDLPYLDSLFSITSRINPDLLLIEERLVKYKPKRLALYSFPQAFQDRINYISTPSRTKKGRFEKEPVFDAYNNRLLQEKLVDTSFVNLRNDYMGSSGDLAVLQQKLKHYQLDGTPIIVLDIPRPKKDKSQYLTSENIRRISSLSTAKRKKEEQLPYWRYPSPLPFSYYSDRAHLNIKGRDHYSAWLSDQLSKYLKDRCSSSNS